MTLNRRDFLARAAGAGLILGLPWIAHGGDQTARPAWLKAALARMRKTRTIGIAFVVPADRMSRDVLRHNLQRLLDKPEYAVRERLVEAVYLAASAEQLGWTGTGNAVRISADGVAEAGAKLTIHDPAEFVKSVDTLLRDDGRLKTRAGAARTKEVATALKAVTAKDEEARRKAVELLASRFPQCRAAVIHARVTAKDDARRAALMRIVDGEHARLAKEPKAVIVGTKWDSDPSGGAIHCPPCGMGHVPATSRGFLRYLTEKS